MTHDNPHNLPTDDSIDAQLDALLAEEGADAQIAPEELEAKVLALTDPQMLALLDEAMAPEPAPARLADNILAATMPGARRETEAERTGVLARIDPMTWRYAAAAAIVLAAGVGLWWSGQSTDVGNPEIADNNNGVESLPEDFVDQARPEILFASATEQVEAKLTDVSDRLNDYKTDRQDIWSDMDGYEQFLADFETEDPATIPAT